VTVRALCSPRCHRRSRMSSAHIVLLIGHLIGQLFPVEVWIRLLTYSNNSRLESSKVGRIEHRSSPTLWPSSQRHFPAKRRPRRPIGACCHDTTPMLSTRAVISDSSSLTSILVDHNSSILTPSQIPGANANASNPT